MFHTDPDCLSSPRGRQPDVRRPLLGHVEFFSGTVVEALGRSPWRTDKVTGTFGVLELLG